MSPPDQPDQRDLERVIIGWYESSMRYQELLDPTWGMVDLRAGLLRLPHEILKERFPRRTPLSYELRAVLDELKAEQQKVRSISNSNHVFTRHNGRPIKDVRRALDLALMGAKLLKDDTPKNDRITPHSFRRAAFTHWTDLAIPRDIAMAISGHALPGSMTDISASAMQCWSVTSGQPDFCSRPRNEHRKWRRPDEVD